MTVLGKQKQRSAENLGKYIIQTIEDYRGNARMNDDLSIVIIEKK